MSTAYISAELECLRHIQKLFTVHTLVIAHTPTPPHCCYGSTLFFAFSSTLADAIVLQAKTGWYYYDSA